MIAIRACAQGGAKASAAPLSRAPPAPATMTLAVLAGLLSVNFGFGHTISTMRVPAVARGAVTTMVESWFDRGERLAAQDASAATVIASWYDAGTRLKIPAGMSASAAVASPELLASALKLEAELSEKRTRLDAFPTQAGTMFFILRDKVQELERQLAQILEDAEQAVEMWSNQELLDLRKRKEELENELLEVSRAADLSKAAAAAAADEWRDRRLRLQTDFDNMKARHANQTAEAQLSATVSLVQEFLSVLDNFDRARVSITPEGAEQEAANAEYVKLQEDVLVTLKELGVQKIPTVGEEFDYNLHMAIQQVPSDEYDEDVICSELQPGYTCRGQLVRAAYVMVSSGS